MLLALTLAGRCPLFCLSLKYLHSWGSELWRRIKWLMINGMCAATFWNASGVCKTFFAPPISLPIVRNIHRPLSDIILDPEAKVFFFIFSGVGLSRKVHWLAILLLSNCLYLPKYLKYFFFIIIIQSCCQTSVYSLLWQDWLGHLSCVSSRRVRCTPVTVV